MARAIHHRALPPRFRLRPTDAEAPQAYSFPFMVTGIHYGIFILFGTALVLSGVYTYLVVPETKGMMLEDMDVLFGIPGTAVTKRRVFDAMRRDAQDSSDYDTEERSGEDMVDVRKR